MYLDNKQTDFIDSLKYLLKEKLPGNEAQKKMAPVVDDKFFRNFKPTSSAKQSAVLALFHYNNNELSLLFTLRSKNISHSGQISFPGGRLEKGETPSEAALRETFEEVGISPEKIELLGTLTNLFVQPSDSIITPIVGYIENLPQMKSNDDEVAEIFCIPFKYFISEKYRKNETWNFKGTDVEVPFWDVHHSTPLWGATAMILMELVAIYNDNNTTRAKIPTVHQENYSQ